LPPMYLPIVLLLETSHPTPHQYSNVPVTQDAIPTGFAQMGL
jgi:hypothetical protein